MQVKVLTFGVAREIVGEAAATVELPAGATADELKTALKTRFPELARITSFALAINNEYAAASQIIAAGDEIAIIPPVSGG